MDPISALGAAAAAVQFLDISLKALEVCRQVRDDEKSSTARNKELEDALRSLKGVRKDLESPTTQTSKNIKDVARKCASTHDELLKLLENVRGAGKQLSTMKAAYRVMRERRTIEKLENTLKERQKLLDRALLQDTW